jgi:hypothetical protein
MKTLTFFSVFIFKKYTRVIKAILIEIAWKLDLQLFMQSVHITIKFASSHPADGEVYSLKHNAKNTPE